MNASRIATFYTDAIRIAESIGDGRFVDDLLKEKSEFLRESQMPRNDTNPNRQQLDLLADAVGELYATTVGIIAAMPNCLDSQVIDAAQRARAFTDRLAALRSSAESEGAFTPCTPLAACPHMPPCQTIELELTPWQLTQRLRDHTEDINELDTRLSKLEGAPVISHCPKCGKGQPDYDGFGVLRCEACGYCSHASIDGDICGLCNQRIGPDGKPAPAPQPDRYDAEATVGEPLDWRDVAEPTLAVIERLTDLIASLQQRVSDLELDSRERRGNEPPATAPEWGEPKRETQPIGWIPVSELLTDVSVYVLTGDGKTLGPITITHWRHAEREEAAVAR